MKESENKKHVSERQQWTQRALKSGILKQNTDFKFPKTRMSENNVKMGKWTSFVSVSIAVSLRFRDESKSEGPRGDIRVTVLPCIYSGALVNLSTFKLSMLALQKQSAEGVQPQRHPSQPSHWLQLRVPQSGVRHRSGADTV